MAWGGKPWSSEYSGTVSEGTSWSFVLLRRGGVSKDTITVIVYFVKYSHHKNTLQVTSDLHTMGSGVSGVFVKVLSKNASTKHLTGDKWILPEK